MSDTNELSQAERRGGYRPEPPARGGHPLFQWPPQPVAIFKWLFGFPGYLWPWPALFISLALVVWLYLTPDPGQMKHFSVNWVAWLFVRNLALLVVFVSVWHVWLYVRKAQGTDYKFNSRWLSVDNPTFLFRNQLWDNVFWNVCSAVPIWTAYEVVTFWLQTNGFAPTVSWQQHPIYCVSLLLLISMWVDVHFYATHRLIHWPPLYRSVHYLHHKNINFGPWSGVAMHPVEHLIYFSGVMLFWVIPSHPLHFLYILLNYALAASVGHLGFGRVVLTKKVSLNTEDYMHYLHHKYFNANFGTDTVPLDRWLGTYHDGSEQAHEAMKKRVRERALRARQSGGTNT